MRFFFLIRVEGPINITVNGGTEHWTHTEHGLCVTLLATVLAGVHPHHGTSGELAEVPQHARPHVGARSDHHPSAQHRREPQRRTPRCHGAIEYCFIIVHIRHFIRTVVRSIVLVVWYGIDKGATRFILPYAKLDQTSLGAPRSDGPCMTYASLHDLRATCMVRHARERDFVPAVYYEISLWFVSIIGAVSVGDWALGQGRLRVRSWAGPVDVRTFGIPRQVGVQVNERSDLRNSPPIEREIVWDMFPPLSSRCIFCVIKKGEGLFSFFSDTYLCEHCCRCDYYWFRSPESTLEL